MTDKLYLPSLRGYIGDWIYYSCIMKIKDASSRIYFAKELHKSKSLSELIQREIKVKRGKKIRDYLLSNHERFFNSMIVAVYGGDPVWYEFGNITSRNSRIKTDQIPADIVNDIGILQFSGAEKLFALDGQHRLAGIKLAFEKKPDLGEEEIAIIFIAHKNTIKGLRRSRRLFTVLNKTAKPVSKGEIIALDEDDTMAITVRRLIEDKSYFANDRIAYQSTNNLPTNNLTSLTTIGNLYDVLSLLFNKIIFKTAKDTLKLNRLNDKDLTKYYNAACDYFDELIHNFQPLKEYAGRNYKRVVKKYRTKNGGNVLFRPIGLTIITEVISILVKKYSWKKAIKIISQLPQDLSREPYKHVIWHPTKKIIINKGKLLTVNLLLYMLNESRYPDSKLLDDYKKATGQQDGSLMLPSKII